MCDTGIYAIMFDVTPTDQKKAKLTRNPCILWMFTTGQLEDQVRRVFEPRHEKTNICLCKNKDADQLRGNREADQRLCFCYIDSTIPLLPKSLITSL